MAKPKNMETVEMKDIVGVKDGKISSPEGSCLINFRVQHIPAVMRNNHEGDVLPPFLVQVPLIAFECYPNCGGIQFKMT